MSSPSRARNSVGSTTSSWDHQGRSSSGYGLNGEARRRWHGGSKVDCEHLLRILSNRQLQWRCVNAQADAALAAQKQTAEVSMHVRYNYKSTYGLLILICEFCFSCIINIHS
jgi:hypothetical protein